MSIKYEFDCPCCGEADEFEEDGCFEICAICNWQNDKVQNNDINYRGGANGISLKEARENFKSFGHSDPKKRPLDPKRLP
ncbi:CPCC family cysteine-rich protein [Shimia sp. MIT1388]|uniref:CPCC family cysteine-rich protein n=1 Tax=Shimia sp. MIT1388 TaxID=3096992 RepID=UPI003999939F